MQGAQGGGSPAGSGGLWWRGRRILALVLRFFLGQGALQGVAILSGIYLVRVLSLDSYAQYGLTLSFQQTISMLMDLGFASTIIPLVGSRGDDRMLVGRYVRAAKHLRDRAFWVMAPIAIVIFILMMRLRGWPWYVQAMLIGSVLVSIYSGGKLSYFSAPLFLYGKLESYYLPQTGVSLGRLLVLLAMRAASVLNGWTAALVSAFGITVNGQLMERECRKHIEWPDAEDEAANREVLHYMLPTIPATIFAAYQTQSSIFLISLFGQTAGIAEVAALGRLGALFGVLGVFNAVIVEPAMAKLPAGKVAERYALLVVLGALCCAPVVVAAFFAPQPVLWLLGSKYRALDSVVGWAMLTGSLNYLSLLMWIMNRARKWVFWSGTFLEIGLTVALQAAFLAVHGMHTTEDAIFFGLATSLGPLTTHVYVMVRGFLLKDGGGRGLRPAAA